MMNIVDGLTFDDVLIKPKYSEIKSRSDVDLSVKLPKGFLVKHPIIPANMKSITEDDMAIALYKSGGLSIIHRFMPIEEQIIIAKKLQSKYCDVMNYVGFSVGVKEVDYINLDKLIEVGVNIICIDIAHGDSKLCVDMCKHISGKYPSVLLIAGNVATGEGAKRLWRAGADVVKVGIGSGSICLTRIETGNGAPQLSAIAEVRQAKMELTMSYYHDGETKTEPEITRQIGIISDGGASRYGDLVKALCFADLVMTGNMFSGALETPGEVITNKDGKFKSYVGSSTHKANHIEGVKSIVPIKGYTRDILKKMTDAITSGCSYQGSSNLIELKNNPQFVRITNAGLRESHSHDVKVIE